MRKITLTFAVIAAVFTMNGQNIIWEDGFEAYDDFAFENIGNWTQIDNDGDNTYTIENYEFTNQGYIGSGIIFNSSAVSPSLAGSTWDARTGDKALLFFASTGNNSETAQNDDYFITPQIDLSNVSEAVLSFWAKSYTDQWGLESFEILLSSTGTSETDFDVNLTGGVIQAPVDNYTEYSYDLSAYEGEQVYIAIHYVSSDTFALMMDDFAVTEGTMAVKKKNSNNFNYFVTSNKLHLSAAATIHNVRLFSILGQEVIDKKLSSNNAEIDLSDLSIGIYLAQVEIAGQTKSFKIVKK